MKKFTNKKIIIPTIVALTLVIGLILYTLANRYLIEHVEISNVIQYESSVNEESTTGSSISVTSVPEETPNVDSTTDDWNYKSDNISIQIKEVTKGEGSDKITYFVADIKLTDATELKSAFAKDSFGTNIIEYTSEIATNNNALFAINGDYYGFRTEGIVIRNGVIYRDTPARMGLAIYKNGTMEVYDETKTTAKELLAKGVWNTLSFGPGILVDSKIPDGIEQAEVDTNFGNHSIQGSQPRTGIGMVDKNHYLFIVVDGRSQGYSKGVTMTEFAELFKSYGCKVAYNLDGGGSSTMYFMGRVVNNPLGKDQERGTSDILYIKENG